jgi:hypothetical protein
MRHAQAGQGSAARHWSHFLGVLRGEDRGQAGKIERGLDVDRFDFRRAVRAAHNTGVMHPRHLDIVDVGGRAGDEARILAPANPLAN